MCFDAFFSPSSREEVFEDDKLEWANQTHLAVFLDKPYICIVVIHYDISPLSQ